MSEPTATLDLPAILRSVPLFGGMTDRSIDSIAAFAIPTSFPDGQVLAREGDPGDSFIVIVTGSATVDQGGTHLRVLGAGDFLGEISLVDGGPRTATVIATAPIEALVIDRAGFSRLMDEFPVVRLEIVSALAQRIRQHGSSALD